LHVSPLDELVGKNRVLLFSLCSAESCEGKVRVNQILRFACDGEEIEDFVCLYHVKVLELGIL
jgi:hypothetical protein